VYKSALLLSIIIIMSQLSLALTVPTQYPQKNGHDELTWVAGYILLKMVLLPAEDHPSNYQSSLTSINFCIKVQRQTMIGDDPSQISCVDDEQDQSEDRIMRYATDDIRNTGTAASTAAIT